MTQRLVALILLTGLGFVAAHYPASAAETPPTNHFRITTGPLLQMPMETALTVMWMTDRDSTGGVEYGPPGGELKTAFASQHGLIDANQRLHKVELRGLTPGTRYRYRVVAREISKFHPYRVTFGETITSEFREFRTLDQGRREFSFLVYNDVHDQPAFIPDLLKVAGAAPYDFVVWNGDMVNHVENEGQITALLDQATAHFATTIPLIWGRGNHETRGRLARQLPQYLALPEGRYYYTFDHGPVHFIVLDTGEDKRDTQREYSGLVNFFPYRREQGEWLQRAVRTDAFRRAKFRVVICHMPFANRVAADPASYKEPDTFVGMAHAYEHFGPPLEQAGVDLMIAGHMHRATLVPPDAGRHSYPIIQGGGSRVGDRTIIRVNVSDTALEAIAIGSDGNPVQTCRVPAKQR